MRPVVLMQLYHGTMTQEQFVTRQEAAGMLGVPVATIDRMIGQGLLRRYRIRERYVRVPKGDVEALLDVPRDWLLRC